MKRRELLELWTHLRQRGRSPDEAEVSNWIKPFLTDLCHWPAARFMPQEKVQPRGPVDMILRVDGQEPVLVEVKRLGLSLAPAMIEKYMRRGSALMFGILTNGETWQIWASGDEVRRLGVRLVRLYEVRAGRGDWAPVEELCRFPRCFPNFRLGLLESSEVASGLLGSSPVVRAAAVQAHRRIWRGPVDERALSAILQEYPRSWKRDELGGWRVSRSLSTEWASWLLAIRSGEVAAAIRDECYQRFKTRRNASTQRVTRALVTAFPMPDEETWNSVYSETRG